MTALADDVYYQLALMVPDDEANGWPFANFVGAMFGPGELVEAWARDNDDGPGWSILVDLPRCPEIALAWLAQFKGVVVPAGMPLNEQRAHIEVAEGLRRGTPGALRLAGQAHLTGAKLVRVVERVGPSVYDLTVITRTSETPDPAATLADLMAAKRIGIRLTHIVSDAPLIDEGTLTIDAGTGDIDTATLADIT